MTVTPESLRRTADFVGQATGHENAKWIRDVASEIERLRHHLNRALRQWRMYAEYEERDLQTEDSIEAAEYRDSLAALPLQEEK